MKIKPYFVLLSSLSCVVTHSATASWLDNLTDKVSEVVAENTDKVNAESVKNILGDTGAAASELSIDELTAGFKEALNVGSQRVVEQLGQSGGFTSDQAIRIPLPAKLQTVKGWLDKVGLGDSMDDLEVRLNRAAEDAVPKARSLFINTVQSMTFEDVTSIYQGGEDAATRYFQEKMTPALSTEMSPVIEQSLADVGAVKLYDDVMGDYQSIPFVPDVKADLVGHVVDGGLEGIFHYLAQEEAAIRQDPVKRTTELLQRVFGASQ